MKLKPALSVLIMVAAVAVGGGALAIVTAPQPVPGQWQGLKVGVLGDSITNPQCGDMLYWRR